MKIVNKHIRFIKEGIFRQKLIKELYFFDGDFQNVVVPNTGDIIYIEDGNGTIWCLRVKYRRISYTNFHSYVEVYCKGSKTNLREIPQ